MSELIHSGYWCMLIPFRETRAEIDEAREKYKLDF